MPIEDWSSRTPAAHYDQCASSLHIKLLPTFTCTMQLCHIKTKECMKANYKVNDICSEVQGDLC